MLRNVLCLVFLLLPSLASAARVFVEPATGPGVPENELATTSELIRSATNQAGQEVVTDRGAAEIVLRPHVLKLGASYVVSLDRVEDGRVVSSDQLKAERIEELDKVATRLTRSAFEHHDAKKDVRVGEVTEQEAHEGTERKPTRKGSLFAFGPASLSNLNASGLAYSFTGAYVWDVNLAMLKIEGDFTGKNNAFLADIGIAGDYFLTDRDASPYVGALAGFGVSKTSATGVFNGETTGGFALGAGTGIQVFRTSAIHLELGVQFTAILGSNALGTPSVFGGHIGLYF